MISKKTVVLSRHKPNVHGKALMRLGDISRGRKYPFDGESSSFYANPWRRDKDWILRSKAFCRLSGKTQVHFLPLNPHISNRMTHTANVVAISLRIASPLKLNTDYQETISWVHDLGHPPGGHNGEKALNIDHAQNGAVILQEIENYGAGLNLSWEVVNAVLRHSRGNKGLYDGDQPEEINVLIVADRIDYVISDIADINFISSTMNGNGRENYSSVCELLQNGLLLDMPEEIEELGSGRNAKEKRISSCVNAVIEESLENGKVSFSQSAVAEKFRVVREWMFDRFYHELDRMEERKRQREDLEIIVEYLEDSSLVEGLPSNVAASLLTDREANWLAKELRKNPCKIDIDRVNQLSAVEIANSLRGKKINHLENPLW